MPENSWQEKNISGWPWLPDKCPPDKYFIDYMKEKAFTEKRILHVGTGLHHQVGIDCCAMGHIVIGMTVSREEVVSRVFRVDTDNYQVMYANINTFDLDLLPQLDIVTLFHFGEMESDFGPVDTNVILRLLDKLDNEGYFFFYNRSAAWDRARVAVKEIQEKGYIYHQETFEELEVYRKA